MEAVKCEAFLAAAELGSLTATAELLGYTQSGVTRMIGTLEEELGFPLFLRSKKGVQLTENGKLMLPLLREVVRAHHNAEQLSAEIGGVSKGSLTIGCYYSISALWMPEILTAFRARYPGVTVRMQEGGNLEMARWLNERSVDCCFGASFATNWSRGCRADTSWQRRMPFRLCACRTSRSSTPRPITTPIRTACSSSTTCTRRPALRRETASRPTTWSRRGSASASTSGSSRASGAARWRRSRSTRRSS